MEDAAAAVNAHLSLADPGRVPMCDLILLTWNRADLLIPCVERLLRYTDVPSRLLVVDNGSTDPPAREFLDHVRGTETVPAAVIRLEENVAIATALNAGLARTRARWICLLNNDILVTTGWLSELIRIAEAHPTIGLLNPMSNEYGLWPQRGVTVDEVGRRCEARGGLWLETSGCLGFCVLVPRPVFERVGFFDEQFRPMYYEDADYGVRVRQAGFLCAVAEGAYVYHVGGATLRHDPKRSERFDQNAVRFYGKWHKERPERLAYVHVARDQARLAASAERIRGLANEAHKVWAFGTPVTQRSLPRHVDVRPVIAPGSLWVLVLIWHVVTKKKRFDRIVVSLAWLAVLLAALKPLHRAQVVREVP